MEQYSLAAYLAGHGSRKVARQIKDAFGVEINESTIRSWATHKDGRPKETLVTLKYGRLDDIFTPKQSLIRPRVKSAQEGR